MRLGHRCPNCGSFRVKRSGARSRLHALYELVLIRTYRCTQCNWPFLEFAPLVRPITNAPARPTTKSEAVDD